MGVWVFSYLADTAACIDNTVFFLSPPIILLVSFAVRPGINKEYLAENIAAAWMQALDIEALARRPFPTVSIGEQRLVYWPGRLSNNRDC